jgi:F0F1-type ATP synthase gamma subunit
MTRAPALADRVTKQLYARLEQGRATRVSLAHATPAVSGEIHVVERTLAPFDFARFPRARNPSPPLISLPPGALLAQLAEEYVFAELCEALTLSLAAENEARMRAMTAAKSNVSKMLDDLIARSGQPRQEEITNERSSSSGRERVGVLGVRLEMACVSGGIDASSSKASRTSRGLRRPSWGFWKFPARQSG